MAKKDKYGQETNEENGNKASTEVTSSRRSSTSSH